MKPFVFLLLFNFALKGLCQDSTAKIDERYLHAVVNIENHNTHSPDFESGTGFLISVSVDSNMFIYLVTNKHVISNNFTPFDPVLLSDSIFVHFYSKANVYKDVVYQIKLKDKSNKPLSTVKLHPDPIVDVAVIDVTSVFIDHSDIAPLTLDTSLLAHYEHLKNINLGLGSQVFALGYPASQKLSGNLPIGKFGFISSSVSAKTEYETAFLNRAGIRNKLVLKGKFFIVDGLLIPGNSGSPIINPKEIKTYIRAGQIKQHIVGNFIVGILSAIVPQTGLSIIFSSDFFLELIRQFPRA